jgi:hypothetical protein
MDLSREKLSENIEDRRKKAKPKHFEDLPLPEQVKRIRQHLRSCGHSSRFLDDPEQKED